MKCVKCGVALADDANFCKECGTAQVLVCKKCGIQVSASDKFCSNCGGNDFGPPDGESKIKDVYGW